MFQLSPPSWPRRPRECSGQPSRWVRTASEATRCSFDCLMTDPLSHIRMNVRQNPRSSQSPVPQRHPASLKRVSVFCGSRNGVKPSYTEAAHRLGQAMLSRNIGLVYGGGGVGMMGRISETVKNGGGEIIGVISKAILGRGVGRR